MIDVDRINALMAPVRELATGYIPDDSLPESEDREEYVLHICINGKHLFYQKLLIDGKWTRVRAFDVGLKNAMIFSSRRNALECASEHNEVRRMAPSAMPLAEAGDLARGILAENEKAIWHIKAALDQLNARRGDRQKRGVEGKHEE